MTRRHLAHRAGRRRLPRVGTKGAESTELPRLNADALEKVWEAATPCSRSRRRRAALRVL